MDEDELRLIKTGLVLRDGTLSKLSPDESVSARFPIDCIHSIALVKRVEMMALAFIVAGAVFCVLAYNMLPGAGWQWVGMVLSVGCIMLGVMGLFGNYVQVKTDEGTVSYFINDGADEALGFVISVAQRIGL